MKIAVVGATGMVGEVMLEVLKERAINMTELILVASEKSLGKKIRFKDEEIEIISLEKALQKKPNIALFSAGSNTSLKWAPKFAEINTVVIDNSSAWRMDPGKKLIIPEINSNLISKEDKIIANPNCSTIQMLMVLAPLHKRFKIKRVVVSTYQSISGTGIKAVKQMQNEREGIKDKMIYPYQIDQNCLPHCDDFLENGYTKEEMKLTNETKKILDKNIKVTATAVRVPVKGGHSESVNIEFENNYTLSEIRSILGSTDGIILKDNTDTNTYPMPLFAHKKDEVFVGRIRQDETQKNSLNLWIVADNLRKGAATNAVQIAEYIINKNLVG